jgi:chloramphenicol-sensitive protein RarD
MAREQLSDVVAAGPPNALASAPSESAPDGGFEPSERQSVAGLAFGLATYIYWGLQPLYFKLLAQVPAAEFVADRTATCAVFMLLLLTALGRWAEFFRSLSKRLLLLLLASALLLAVNWLFYISSVVTGRIVETSLGYFINPLFSVLLGMIFLGERPARLQIAAIVLAAVGIAYIVCRLTYVPWLALGVAGSFGLYGLIRKVANVETLTGLTIETVLLTPLALGYLFWQSSHGDDAFASLGNASRALLLASGAVTAIPLLFFGAAARRLPLATLGFLQFVSPSIQLALAVWLYGEPFSVDHAVTFGFIWAGLALFLAESILARRRQAVLRPSRDVCPPAQN